MQTLFDLLKEAEVPLPLRQCIASIAHGVEEISDVIRTAKTGKEGTKNIYGEEQLALDVLSDRLVAEHLEDSGVVCAYGSEERDGLTILNNGEGDFTVVSDPLDGSSLVDVNMAVGSIFGVYPCNDLIGRTGDDQVAAAIAVYGPRTTFIIAFANNDKIPAPIECTLYPEGFVVTKERITVAPEGKYFAPGNLRATAEREDYATLMHQWMREQYTLRYSGGMVPDVNHILLKGKGVFVYPGYSEAPQGKLRLVFECAPLAFIMEHAGGRATDGDIRILQKPIQKLDQRTPIYLGSIEEVKRVEQALS